MGSQSFISKLFKKTKHNSKQVTDKNSNKMCDEEQEKVNQFLEMINCYSNVKNKK
ncbi:hypothetical protein [Desulfoscipio sp. XC116]|uniref:hypothetical protein n=1 Tax=Desulfoscipio sp. XC116 TaxID=3144975 RepID=UPI00325BA5F4